VSKIDPLFEDRLRRQPEEAVRVIVRISAEPPEVEARLQEVGAQVLFRFSLIRALAISCTAEAALLLLSEPWVESIEEDRQVFAQPFDPEPHKTGGGDE